MGRRQVRPTNGEGAREDVEKLGGALHLHPGERGPHLVLLPRRLQLVGEQIVVLRQQGDQHRQPVEDQQEAFGQRSLVWPENTQQHG